MSYEKQSVKHQIERIERDKHIFKQTQTDRMSRFGADVPRILQLIQQNASRFQQRPLGPIGDLHRLCWA